MTAFNRLTQRYPIISTMLLVLLSIVLSQVGAVLLSSLFSDISREVFAMYTRYGTALLTILLLWRLGAMRNAYISTPMSQWGSKWCLAALPIVTVGVINMFGVEWSNIQLVWQQVPFWVTENLATGVFEETMMRGLAFYLLYRAWQHQHNGLMKAAWAQAIIFGVIHLINLVNGVSIDVFAQVIYATFLGFAFAGIVAYTRSIWPAAVAHGFVNAIANINHTFVPDYVSEGTSALAYAFFIAVIALIAVLPGYYMLSHSHSTQLKMATV